jgi:triosephosphate isomerase
MNAPRRPLVVGNWKMHKTIAEARALASALCALEMPGDVDVAIAPPSTALDAVAQTISGSTIALAAQTVHESAHGAFTGEIAPPMLVELGVRYVILGHSERRQYYNETDDGVGRKVRAALHNDITPIVAVGETADQHTRGETLDHVLFQVMAAFAGLPASDVAKCVVAYEPIWAIGTGLSDTPDNADRVLGEIRRAVDGLADVPLLYGGSMKPDNAAALLEQPNIDGGLVGSASLSADSFWRIVAAAATRGKVQS